MVFLYGEENPPALLLKYTSKSTFLIKNFEDIIVKKSTKNKFDIPPNIHLTLMGITLSTIRGILREKLAATALNGIILPLIGSDTLAKDLGVNLTAYNDNK